MVNVKSMEYAIFAQEVIKHYRGRDKNAGLNGFNLAVRPASIFGLLGPNGAGKTTAIRILSTLLRPDSGKATVAGFDVVKQARQVRQNIGLVGQYAAVDEILTGQQNLVMFGRLNHLSAKHAQQRADELLGQFGLTDAAKISAAKYSGGMRRRLDLAASLIVSPAILFVDEPTTGLDPAGRQQVWSVIRSLAASGTTILLTTQYLEEADQLSDRISILQAGRVIAEGSPDQLKSTLGGDWIDISLGAGVNPDSVIEIVRPFASDDIRIDPQLNRVSIPVTNHTQSLVKVAGAISLANIELTDIVLRRPTLDEVFIHLTGSSETGQLAETK
ncbi:MAG: daunorubicin/doxorubicin resistance ABC transporter ATP-binding protein DrrA [Chloroflexi bacterium HGW-Chloroflexi-10]|nr:MAG: daunorubicin/doxorubicin resistance ABC transporter ATP-binding protein DrrA [Chloroflexi bacterium HGW-Chloroflexi-10]